MGAPSGEPARRHGGLPAEGVQQSGEVGGQRRAAHQPFSSDRMDEQHLDAGQQEATATEHVVEQPVVAALAVGRVANDRVGEVLEMAT